MLIGELAPGMATELDALAVALGVEALESLKSALVEGEVDGEHGPTYANGQGVCGCAYWAMGCNGTEMVRAREWIMGGDMALSTPLEMMVEPIAVGDVADQGLSLNCGLQPYRSEPGALAYAVVVAVEGAIRRFEEREGNR